MSNSRFFAASSTFLVKLWNSWLYRLRSARCRCSSSSSSGSYPLRRVLSSDSRRPSSRCRTGRPPSSSCRCIGWRRWVDDHEDLLLGRLEGEGEGRRSGVRRRGRRDAEAGCGGGMWRRDVLGRDPSAHLEESELDVREDQVELLAARRRAQAVGVELEGARRLLAAERRPDVDVAQPVHLPRPDRLERLLDDEVGLEVLLLVARLHALAQLFDQPEGVVEVRRHLRLQRNLADEVRLLVGLGGERRLLARERRRHAERDELDAQLGPPLVLVLHDVLGGGDVEGDEAAVPRTGKSPPCRRRASG